MPHVLDNGVRSGDLDVLLPAAGRARRAHLLLGVAACADHRGIAAAPRKFEGEPAGSGNARHLAFLIQRRAMDCSCRWEEHPVNGLYAEFRLDAQLASAFGQPFAALAPEFRFRLAVFVLRLRW